MYDGIVAHSKAEVREGMEALGRGNPDAASKHFWNAMDCLADVQDDRRRRDELGPLAIYYVALELYDLALIGAHDAIVLDKKLGQPRQLAEDIVTLGNANMRLGKMDEATENYTEALQLCLDNGDYDNAASASTNLASILANQDKMREATTLLRNSLDYLTKKPHPNTEKITRMTLIQVLGLQKENPEELIDVAEKLLERFGHEIPRGMIDTIRPYIDDAVEQYLKANPSIHPLKWKLAHFPRLY